MEERVLLWIIAGLLVLVAVLRLRLAAKRGEVLSGPAKLQACLFPGAMLVAVLLQQLQLVDIVIPVLLIGMGEEFLCWLVRRAASRAASED